MSNVKFSKIRNRSYAKGMAADPNTIYFTADTKDIIIGGNDYGATKDVRDRLTAVEGNVTTALAAASNAQQSANAALVAAEQTSEYFYGMYAILGSLPDGSAVTAEVASLSSSKADKVSGTVEGNLAKLDLYGNIANSGIAANNTATLEDVVISTSSVICDDSTSPPIPYTSGPIYITVPKNKSILVEGGANHSYVLKALDSSILAEAVEGNLIWTNNTGSDLSVLIGCSTATTLNTTVFTPGLYSKYTKPLAGIPFDDLAYNIQVSLGKADTAYQLPSSGIPIGNLESGVLTSLGKADTAVLPSAIVKMVTVGDTIKGTVNI